MSASCEDWVGPALLTLSSSPEIKRPPSHQHITRPYLVSKPIFPTMSAATIGRITTALASGHNENQLSLVNLNPDFTLLKVQAPLQFEGIDSMISSKRKENAESGLRGKESPDRREAEDSTIPIRPRCSHDSFQTGFYVRRACRVG